MKRKGNNRKGAVMEFALLMMMVVFSLGLVITTSSMIQTNHKQREQKNLEKNLELNAKGEQICKDSNFEAGENNTLVYEDTEIKIVLDANTKEILEWTIK